MTNVGSTLIIPNDFLKDSVLVLTDDDKSLILSWLNHKLNKSKLIFRGTRDGFTSKAFHEKCN